MKTIFTIGHSNKSIDIFVNRLVKERIQVLVDVRSVPYSKYNFQFNRENLRKEVEMLGIKYVFRGRNLGGKMGNSNWDEAIDELCRKCENRRIAIMCSEASPENCHRHSTIQPAIEKKGVVIEHILWEGTKLKKQKTETIKLSTLFD